MNRHGVRKQGCLKNYNIFWEEYIREPQEIDQRHRTKLCCRRLRSTDRSRAGNGKLKVSKQRGRHEKSPFMRLMLIAPRMS